jgi:hypothetical protein
MPLSLKLAVATPVATPFRNDRRVNIAYLLVRVSVAANISETVLKL